MAPVCSLCYAAADTRDHLFVTCNFAAESILQGLAYLL